MLELGLAAALALVDILAEVVRSATNAGNTDTSLVTALRVVHTEVASRAKAATAAVTVEVARGRPATLVEVTATCPETVLKDRSATTV